MSREPKAVHLAQDEDFTRCHLLIEGLDTRVSSGTREWVLKTTTEISEVTCKNCLKKIAGTLQPC